MARLVHFLSPFNPQECEQWASRDGTIWEMAPKTNLPYVCIHNGDYLLRADWGRRPGAGDHVAFVVLPQKGGGGAKNVFRFVALIALAFVAPQIGAALFGAGTFGAAVTAFAITTIGSILLAPKQPSGLTGNELAAASPTYTIGAQQNSARLGQPIPVGYGRLRVFPDLAAQPYTEYDNESYDQTLYILLAVGMGDYEISEVKLEDTPIGNFPDVETNIVTPGGVLALVEPWINAVEAGGQELLGTVDGVVQWVGPYVVNPAATTINEIAVDLIWPRGNYELGNEGPQTYLVTYKAEAQLLDDQGTAVGSWFTLFDEGFGDIVSEVRRITLKTVVDSGRYQVRVGRTSVKPEESRVVTDIVLGAVRGFLENTLLQPNTTYFEFKARATNSLNDNTARRLNMVTQRAIPTYDGVEWTGPVATRSIVWAFCDVLRRADYGGGLPDSRLALQELYDLDQVLQSRMEFFDGRFDTLGTQWEVAQIIARTGFCVALPVGGQVTLVRDAPQEVPSAMFTPRNMVKGSFRIEYEITNEENPQAYEFTYLDERTWRENRVVAIIPDAPSEDPEELRVASARLFGITNELHAQRQADYLAMSQTVRRRLASFDTEMDGLILRYGQQVLLSHDSMRWGTSGEVASMDGLVLTLTEPVTFASGDHYIKFNLANGVPQGPLLCFPGDTAYKVVLDTAPSAAALTGYTRERSRFVFGNAVEVLTLGKIKTIKPSDAFHCSLSVVLDDERVYQTLGNNIPTTVSRAGYYAPDDAPVYDDANETEREDYGYFADFFGRVGANGDAGYAYVAD